MRYRTILLFGAPGSGKGTQGQILGAMPGFHHLACGDVFRSLDPKSPMGLKFAEFSRVGSLVPDELTVELWRQTIEQRIHAGQFNPAKDVLLLDGIPRTLDQAKLMDNAIDVPAIIYLVCNNVAEIMARLQHRALKGNRPDDANEEVIRHRLDVYEEQTRPVLEHYAREKIYRINAAQAVESVSGEVLKVISVFRK